VTELVRENNRCTQQSFLISTAYNYFVVEVDYREGLRIKRNNILPKADVVINLVTSEPRSIGQIKDALVVHGHTHGDSIRKLKTLLDRLEVVRFPFMCSPDKKGNKKGWGWRYGLLDKIVEDFANSPDDCNYINRTSWYLKQTLGDRFYRSLDQ
jgi:hypothetical protein